VMMRTSLIQVLALAMDEMPDDRPYLNGETYVMLPELLVPRVLWPGKPRGTLPTETIGIYLGIQTEEGTERTGISVGPMAEAWANLGWLGMVASGAFLGLLFGIATRISIGLVPSQVGWLLSAVVLTYSIKMEFCLAELCSSLLQALAAAFAVLFCFSHRPKKASTKRMRANPISWLSRNAKRNTY